VGLLIRRTCSRDMRCRGFTSIGGYEYFAGVVETANREKKILSYVVEPLNESDVTIPWLLLRLDKQDRYFSIRLPFCHYMSGNRGKPSTHARLD